ncbi:MAG: NAD(P)H-hydrate dehydratase [Candidatus Lokiarchaeota archaeon]|nr:NAD(P)H-hydrate dehydratase [Candidatus Lokiarchaeota archaeon]
MQIEFPAFMRAFAPGDTMTSEDMFVLDENSEGLGIEKVKLMENAGAAVARVIAEHFSPLQEKTIHVFCGLGNNGGDGLVAARHLGRAARAVKVYIVGDPALIGTAEARSNWNALVQAPFSIQIEVLKDSSQLDRVQGIDSKSIIVDALLGAGIKGNVREPVAAAIRKINALREGAACPVVAVDVPSGLNMDDGTTSDVFAMATRSVTFHLQKKGMVNKKDITGIVDVVPIGIPPEAEWLVGKGDVKLLLKNRRDPRSVKGMNGKVLVIGGSKQYSGAAILSALAASRCGVDLVNLCIPEPTALVARMSSPDLIVTPLDGSSITERNVPELEGRIRWADAILIGPGMGREPGTEAAIAAVCRVAVEARKRLVVDADALKAIAKDVLTIDDPNVIVTPHAGEFAIVSKTNASNLTTLEQRLLAAREFTRGVHCQLVLKGPEDVVMNGQRCKINVTHTPAMTVGGTGDVLAGIAAGLASRYGHDPGSMFTVACAAIHVNGLAGMASEQQMGGQFITASMMIDSIGTVLSRLS